MVDGPNPTTTPRRLGLEDAAGAGEVVRRAGARSRGEGTVGRRTMRAMMHGGVVVKVVAVAAAAAAAAAAATGRRVGNVLAERRDVWIAENASDR